MTQKALEVSWETGVPGGHDRLITATYSSTKALADMDQVRRGISSLKVHSGLAVSCDSKIRNPGPALQGRETKTNTKRNNLADCLKGFCIVFVFDFFGGVLF